MPDKTLINFITESPSVSVELEIKGPRWTNARAVHHLRERSRFMLIVSSIVIILSFVLSLKAPGNDSWIEIGGFRLPSLCTSRSWFGFECPGCGLTRSFVAISQGDFVMSLKHHRVGWVLYLAVLLQVPYRLYLLRELKSKVVKRNWPQWFGFFLIAVLIVNWFSKIIN